jgi:putative endonuclease
VGKYREVLMNKVSIGREAEQIAADYLEEHGYAILDRNYTFKHMGEIDIVAEIDHTLVFIEVRFRRSRHYGSPEGSLTPRKLRTIRRVAEAWMAHHRRRSGAVRFDMIAVELMGSDTEIRHHRNAF